MKVEISALFGMDYSTTMVKKVHIGDGVYLEEIKLNDQIKDLFGKVKEGKDKDYRALRFREALEWHVYTHRFYISIEGTDSLQSEQVNRARQLIMRAIVLSRILRPMPIPLHPTKLFCNPLRLREGGVRNRNQRRLLWDSISCEENR